MRSQPQLNTEDQAALDQMRADDAASEPVETTQVETGQETPALAETETQEPEQQAGTPKQTLVPHAALHEEREARKRLERELTQEREARALLDQRTNLILERMNRQAAPAEPELPTLEQDPVGHIVGKQQEIERQVRQSSEQAAQQQQQVAQYMQTLALQQAITQRAQGLEAEFSAEHGDYHQAIEHLRAARHQELALLGMNADQRAQTIQQEGLAIAVHALQNNGNPAQLLYELAKMRGFNGAKTAEAPAPNPAAGQRLQNIAAGQRQARSLSDSRGSAPAPLTAQRLLELSPKEFEKMMNTPEGKAIMGS